MKRFLFSLVFSVFCVTSYGSGFDFNTNCRTAYLEMLDLNLARATTLLNNEKKINPANAAVPYMEHYIDFLKAFLSEEDKDFSQLKNNLDKRLEVIEKNGTNSPWLKMVKGEMLLQLAVIKLKRKEYLSAGYYVRKSYNLLEENQRQYPAFVPNLKVLGFLHAIIGSVPENYKWLANLVGMKGTIAQGGNELSQLLKEVTWNKEYSFLQLETGFLKIFISAHLEKNSASALAHLEKLKKSVDAQSPLFVFLEVNTCIAAGKSQEALEKLKSFSPQPSQFPFHYLSYLRGILKLNNLNEDASQDFSKYLSEFRGQSFIKSAWHKQAWISLLNSDTTAYYKNLQKVKTNGGDFTDEDKQAYKDAVSNEMPNIVLLRSRLLFDGGNYNSALTELTGKPAGNFSRFKDQLEYTYRLARIFDKKGQVEKAIQFYETTYLNGKRSEYYFAANAALNNGLLYESTGDKTNAAGWFKKCLELRNHEYQNSIDQKAEAGLNRINNTPGIN